MSSFLTNHGVVVALVCAACAVAYGLLTTRSLLSLSPGNEQMQSISGAVQQGAHAYLNRQYTTIAGVGVVLFIALIFVQNIAVAGGFAIGGLLSGSTGYIGMNVSVRANARVAEAARVGVTPMDRHFAVSSTIPEFLVVQSPQELRTPQALAALEQMAQRVSQLPGIATIRSSGTP